MVSVSKVQKRSLFVAKELAQGPGALSLAGPHIS